MAVRWLKYLWDEPRLATPQEFEQLEHRWGVSLPEEYKRVAAAHQGMTPEPGVFDVGRGTNVISLLLTVSGETSQDDYSALGAFEVLKPHVPEGLYPFAETPGGEYVCFDYRESQRRPRVVLITVEMDIHPIASSFSEFLSALHSGSTGT
jgi:cell wall assembly regulator SMI1